VQALFELESQNYNLLLLALLKEDPQLTPAAFGLKKIKHLIPLRNDK